MTTTFRLTASSLVQYANNALATLDSQARERGTPATLDELQTRARLDALRRTARAVPGLTSVQCCVDDLLLLLGARTML